MNDPLSLCPEGCLLESRHSFCPWHGHPLQSLIGQAVADAYRIERLVSDEGGFGVVYFAKNQVDSGQDFEAAVKVLRPNACYDPQAVNEFIDEADRCYRLLNDCRHTAKVLVASKLPFPYIAMSFENGGSLRKKLDEVRSKVRAGATERERQRIRAAELPWRRVYDMLLGIADALQEAHRKDVVHRDLKPSNILLKREVDGSELPKVVDWGIAIAKRERKERANASADVVGSTTRTLQEGPSRELQRVASQITIKYAPPEVFEYATETDPARRNLKKVFDPRTDVYQFGLVAFELLTAEFPFDAPPPDARTDEREDHWRHQHCRIDGTRPYAVSRFRGDLGKAVWALQPRVENMVRVVERCLEKEPQRRYANGDELLKALETEPLWRRVTRYASACALVAVLGLVLWRLGQQPVGVPAGVFKDAPRWSESVPLVVAEETQGALLSPQDDEHPVCRFWTRDLKRLQESSAAYTSSVLIPSKPGNNKVTAVRIQPWRRESMRGDISVPARIAPEGEVPASWQKRIVQQAGTKVRFNLSELAAYVRDRANGGVPEAFHLFSIETTFPDSPPSTDFLELCVDPTPATIASHGVAVLTGTAGVERVDYDLGTETTAPNVSATLYLPEDTADLIFEFSTLSADQAEVILELGALPSATKSRNLGDAAVVRYKLSELLPGKQLKDLTGSALVLRVAVSDKAGREPSSARELRLQLTSKLGLRALTAAPVLRRNTNGTASTRVRLPGVAAGASVLAYWRVADLAAGPSGDGTLTPASDGTPDAYDVTLSVPSGLQNAVLKAQKVDVYLLRDDLSYPGFPHKGDATRLQLCALEFGDRFSCSVPPARPIDRADFELTATGFPRQPDERKPLATTSAGEPSLWRARSLERWPGRLELTWPADSAQLDLENVQWAIEGMNGAPATGRTFNVPPLQEKGLVNGALILQAPWQSQDRFSFRLELEPTIQFDPVVSVVRRDGERGEPILVRERGTTRIPQYVSSPGEMFFGVQLEDSARVQSLTLAAQSLQFEGVDRVTFKTATAVDGVFLIGIQGTDGFGNSFDVPLPPLIVLGDKPEVLVLQVPGGEVSVSPSPQDGKVRVPVNINDSSGIEFLRITVRGADAERQPIEVPLDSKGAVKQFVDARPGPLRYTGSIPVIRSDADRLIQLSFDIEDLLGAGEAYRVEVAAYDRRGDETRRTTTEVTVVVGADEPMPLVPYLGLDWVRIPIGGDKGFYISRTEIPRGFWDNPVNPPPQWSPVDMLPKTDLSPRQILDGLKGTLAGFYLATRREWDKVLENGNAGMPANAVLFSVANCADGELGTVKRRDNDRGFLPVDLKFGTAEDAGVDLNKLFFGLVHVFGNAEEIVVGGAGKYFLVGGHYETRLRDCNARPAAIDSDYRGPKSGFRLVVYDDAGGILDRDGGRQVNDAFKGRVEQLRQDWKKRNIAPGPDASK